MNSANPYLEKVPDQQGSQRRANRPVVIGELISPIIENVRFRRNVDALHRKGPRCVYELLKEVGARFDCQEFINQRTERYAAIKDDDLDDVGGHDLPQEPLHTVTP